MKGLFILLVGLLLACGVGVMVSHDPGYVLLAFGRYSVEMPLWTLAVVLVVGFVLLHEGLLFGRFLSSISLRFDRWSKRRQKRSAYTQTSLGLIELAEGDWARAEKLLVKGAGKNASPLINFLSAARAAQELGAYDRRDDYLRKAHAVMPDAEVAIGLTQAELQLKHNQLEQALATLSRLQKSVPRHTYVLKLLYRLYRELHDWPNLQALLPLLRKLKLISDAELDEVELTIMRAEFDTVSQKHPEQLGEYWERLTKKWRYHPAMVADYAKHLILLKSYDAAYTLLVKVLGKCWDERLILLYGQIPYEDVATQYARAEKWQKQYVEHQSSLFLTLGRLSLRQQLWGKARHYLEQAITLGAGSVAYRELGGLFEQMGEKEEALKSYRQGLQGCLVQEQSGS